MSIKADAPQIGDSAYTRDKIFGDNATLINDNAGYQIRDGKRQIGELFSPIYDVDYNISKSTDDISTSVYSISSEAGRVVIDNTDTILHNGATLMKMTTSNFYAYLQQRKAGGVPIAPEKVYLVSFYCCNLKENQLFKVGGYGGSTKNHYRYASPTITRHCFESTGTDMAHLYSQGGNPIGEDTSIFAVNDIYIGGVQVEEIPAIEKRMVAFMGDSTVQGSSGDSDLDNASEWSKLAGSVCGFGVFNRGVGGDQTSQMISRWSTDITPLASNCKYVVIQGGINDLGKTGTTTQTILANLETMYQLALTDGFEPIMCTISPCNKSGSDETVRNEVNTAIKATYRDLIDLDYILKSTSDESQLDSRWINDGVHFGLSGKKAIANSIYKDSPFVFREPLPYFPKA